MVVSIIEKVYSFLWGDWIKIPLPGGRQSWHFTADYFVNSNRNLFYDSDKVFTDKTVPGYGAGTGSKEGA